MGSGEQVDHRTTLQVVRKNGKKNSVPEKDFDRYMDAHLAFADSLVSGVDQVEARAAIQKWERYAG